MSPQSPARRHFLGATGALALGGLPLAARAQPWPVTVGIIHVGPRDDCGWNQAHAVATNALAATPGVRVVEEENVRETVEVRKTLGRMDDLIEGVSGSI